MTILWLLQWKPEGLVLPPILFNISVKLLREIIYQIEMPLEMT